MQHVRERTIQSKRRYRPSIPDALDLLVFWGILLERVDIVADFERDDISVHEMLVARCIGGVGEGGQAGAIGELGVAAIGRERVYGVPVDDERQGLPYALALPWWLVCKVDHGVGIIE